MIPLRRIPPRIGLTGGVATGKSGVARQLAACGAVVIDADALVHDLYARSLPLRDQLQRTFGDEIVTADGCIDRPRLAATVFADASSRRQLEAIVHPFVWQAIVEAEAVARAAHPPMIVCDVPLLYEVADPAYFDAVIVAACRPETELARVMARCQCDEAAARQRIAAQLPLAEKIARADVVIWTDGPVEDTARLVDAVYRSLLTGAPQQG